MRLGDSRTLPIATIGMRSDNAPAGAGNVRADPVISCAVKKPEPAGPEPELSSLGALLRMLSGTCNQAARAAATF